MIGFKGVVQVHERANLEPWHPISPKKNTKSPARQGAGEEADLNKASKWDSGQGNIREPELSPLLLVLTAGSPKQW